MSNFGQLVSQAYIHDKIHRGELFTPAYAKAIASSGTLEICITTADIVEELHISPVIDMAIEAKIEYFIAPVFTAGTIIPATNRNLNSTNTLGATFVHTPTITSPGTLAIQLLYGAGKTSGGVLRTEELVFVPNTKYLIRVTNLSGSSANNVTAIFYCYEEEPEY